MDADLVRGRRGEKRSGDHHAQQLQGQLRRSVTADDIRGQRADDADHERQINDQPGETEEQ